MKFLFPLVCIIAFLSTSVFAQKEPVSDQDKIIYKDYTVPVLISCDGEETRNAKNSCTQKRMLQFVSRNVDYPDVDRENNIEGNVVAQFVVGKEGSVEDVRILRSVSPTLDKEVIRVIKKLGPFVKTKNKIRMVLPVRFKLQDAYTEPKVRNIEIGKSKNRLFWGKELSSTINKSDLYSMAQQSVKVRDLYGAEASIEKLRLEVIKKGKLKTAEVRGGELDARMLKLLRKSKKISSVRLIATVPKGKETEDVSRTFTVE